MRASVRCGSPFQPLSCNCAYTGAEEGWIWLCAVRVQRVSYPELTLSFLKFSHLAEGRAVPAPHGASGIGELDVGAVGRYA